MKRHLISQRFVRRLQMCGSGKNADVESGISANRAEKETAEKELEEVKAELTEWENQKEPQPERSEAVIRNRSEIGCTWNSVPGVL